MDTLNTTDGWVPIKAIDIIREKITTPAMDGTRGDGLYDVPIKLSAAPNHEWTQIFMSHWARPPHWTSSHRSDIAHIYGDELHLEGTTIEEVKKTHKKTVNEVIEETNKDYANLLKKRRLDEDRRQAKEDEHRRHIDDETKDWNFGDDDVDEKD